MVKQNIIPDLYFIPGPDQSRFPFCNSFLIEGDIRVLIDAGTTESVIRDLDREKRIDVLILTHSHPDHMLAAHALSDRHLIVPRETPESVHDLLQLGKRFTGTDEGADQWVKQMQGVHGLNPLKVPDQLYCQGQHMDFGPITLEPVHVPGHLIDHYAFYIERQKVLLTTDIDFSGFGPWYGNEEADIRQFYTDIERLASFDAAVTVSSHKPPIYSGAGEYFRRYLNSFRRQQKEVLDCCQNSGNTLNNMVELSPFYGNRFPNRFLQRIFERTLIKKNLNLLVDSGHLALTNGIYCVTEETDHENH